MKKMPERETMVLTENVKSIGPKSQDNWTGESAVKRIENDSETFNALADFFIDITEEEGGKARSSKVAVSMIAFMIKRKFDNDAFIASKLHFTYIQYRFVPLYNQDGRPARTG